MKVKHSGSDRVLTAVGYIAVTLLAVTIAIPFMNIFSTAFSGYNAVVSGRVSLIPVDFTFSTMSQVINSRQFLSSFANSVQIMLAGTFCSVFVSGVAAYALSKQRLLGRGFLTAVFVFTMMFSGGMIPNYILIRQLGLLNNILSLFLPGAISVYNMLIMKNAFEAVPAALEESAKIDGAGNFIIFLKIYLPVSLPSIAAVSLFLAVGYWNEYWSAMMYITKNEFKPLQLYLLDVIQYASDPLKSVDQGMDTQAAPEAVRAATILAATVPILLVYPFLQKYFVKGVMLGSVKE